MANQNNQSGRAYDQDRGQGQSGAWDEPRRSGSDWQSSRDDKQRQEYGDRQQGRRQYQQEDGYRSAERGGYQQEKRAGQFAQRDYNLGNYDFDQDRNQGGYRGGYQGGDYRGGGLQGGYDQGQGRYDLNWDNGRGNQGYRGGASGGFSWGQGSSGGGMWDGDNQQRSGQSYRGRGPKNYQRSDERIREDVSDRLSDDHDVDASDIEVSVSNREVILSGEVDSKEAKRRAEDCAESCSGVDHVQNNLRVKQSQRWGSNQESSKVKNK